MKSNKYILSILLSGIIGMTACTDSFERYNTPHFTGVDLVQ